VLRFFPFEIYNINIFKGISLNIIKTQTMSSQNQMSYGVDEEEITQRFSNTSQKKTGKRKYFPSNRPQTLIRNAITGVEYPYYTGSSEQTLLYKCVDSTGTCDSDGYMIRSSNLLPNSNPNHLFFDSPEQCMRHMHITISAEMIQNWHKSHSEQTLEDMD